MKLRGILLMWQVVIAMGRRGLVRRVFCEDDMCLQLYTRTFTEFVVVDCNHASKCRYRFRVCQRDICTGAVGTATGHCESAFVAQTRSRQ